MVGRFSVVLVKEGLEEFTITIAAEADRSYLECYEIAFPQRIVASMQLPFAFRNRQWRTARGAYRHDASLFVIRDSPWLPALRESAAGTIDSRSIVHYAIYGSGVCVDVVTWKAPHIHRVVPRQNMILSE